MSHKKSAVPDAWDDDWENLADTSQPEPPQSTKPEILSNAERKARHANENKQLWEAAEAPASKPIFLQTRETAPLSTEWKPQLKLLSRKPQPNPAAGATNPVDEDDSEDERRRKAASELAERQARAQKEREEKQRRYQEVRERLFGPSEPANPGASGRGVANEGGSNANSRNSSRGKGRGRADRNTLTDGSPARASTSNRQLFDPNESTRPDSRNMQRGKGQDNKGTAALADTQTIRAPRGPDGSGRGGFGFSNRGGLTG